MLNILDQFIGFIFWDNYKRTIFHNDLDQIGLNFSLLIFWVDYNHSNSLCSISKIFQIHQVFDFTKQPFEIHPDFIQLLERSSNAFIVLFIGHSRVGKSRRFN
jgi:hypothetical protein